MRIPSAIFAATLFLTFGFGVSSTTPASASEQAAAQSYNLVIGGMT